MLLNLCEQSNLYKTNDIQSSWLCGEILESGLQNTGSWVRLQSSWLSGEILESGHGGVGSPPALVWGRLQLRAPALVWGRLWLRDASGSGLSEGTPPAPGSGLRRLSSLIIHFDCFSFIKVTYTMLCIYIKK